MRLDVKHDSSLSWDLLVARPLWACLSDENKKLLIWRKENRWVSLFLYEAFISSFFFLFYFVSSFDLPITTPSSFVCMSYTLVFLPLIRSSVLDRMTWKQSIRLSAVVAGSLGFLKTLKCGESNFDTKVMWPAETRTLKNRGVVVKRNTTARVSFWSCGRAAALSGVLASTDHNTDVWSERMWTQTATCREKNIVAMSTFYIVTELQLCWWL